MICDACREKLTNVIKNAALAQGEDPDTLVAEFFDAMNQLAQGSANEPV